MSDLKWVTLSFIQNLIETISRDVILTEAEKEATQLKAKSIKTSVQDATTDDEVEKLHHSFHNLSNEVYKLRLRHHVSNLKQ